MKTIFFLAVIIFMSGCNTSNSEVKPIECKKNNSIRIPDNPQEENQQWERIDLDKTPSSLSPNDFIESQEVIQPDELRAINERLQSHLKQVDLAELKNNKHAIAEGVNRLIKDLTRSEYKHQYFSISTIHYDKKTMYKYTVNGTGKLGVVDAKGSFLLLPIYDYLFPAKNRVIFEFNQLRGLMDLNYEIISIPQYDYILRHEDIFEVALGNKHGFIDAHGKLITPFVLDEISGIISEGLIIATKDQKSGTIDILTGEVITPFKFDKLGKFSNGLAEAQIGNHTFVIDKNGDCIERCEIPPWLYENEK